MRQFETLVKEDKLFDVEIVWKSSEGKKLIYERSVNKITKI